MDVCFGNHKGEIVVAVLLRWLSAETPFLIFTNPDTDTWRIGPRFRKRTPGICLANKIYLVCGIQDGPRDGMCYMV
jgi:hypothetical protein